MVSNLFPKVFLRNKKCYVISECCLRKGALTPFSKVLPKKLMVAHLGKKFSDCYGTRKFITICTEAVLSYVLSSVVGVRSAGGYVKGNGLWV